MASRKPQAWEAEEEASPRRSCGGCLWRLVKVTVLLLLLGGAVLLLSFWLFPPFGAERSARVLLLGLDDEPRQGGARRADTIMLYGANLQGGGALLLSVPRDARVHLPGYRGYRKINAAYAYGKSALVRHTLAQRSTMDADCPYYLTFDSKTVSAMVDAMGGVVVDVPERMKYDDDWGYLHIDLQPGRQRLNGTQVVGFLRWRKNNNGGHSSTDTERAARQRALVAAIADTMRTPGGMVRAPLVYAAFRAHTVETNLSLRHLLLMLWISRPLDTASVGGRSARYGGISYIICAWDAARAKWRNAVE